MAQASQSTDPPQPTIPGTDIRTNGHLLMLVTEWLPTRRENASIGAGHTALHCTTYWRCRNCGQERSKRDGFLTDCEHVSPPTPLDDADFSIDEPRTRRALTQDLDVAYVGPGPTYSVEGTRGVVYTVDVAHKTCTCPDQSTRATNCKHLRRVDLEIRAGTVPRPNGRFTRTPLRYTP